MRHVSHLGPLLMIIFALGLWVGTMLAAAERERAERAGPAGAAGPAAAAPAARPGPAGGGGTR